MFQLSPEEAGVLKCQSGISSLGHGGRRRSLPYPFTEQGVAMLSASCGANVTEPMKLPHAEKATVEREKIVDYLLNATHPDNAGKAPTGRLWPQPFAGSRS